MSCLLYTSVEKWGCIQRWDAAPELPGAMQFGKYITGKGILASVAHTQAEYEDILLIIFLIRIVTFM